MLLLVAVGALVWIGSENRRLHETYLKERSADLEAALHVEKVRLSQAIEALRRDVVFLANTPPVPGMVRASANRGIDPRDRNTYAAWEARLQEIFAAFLRAHPEYLQARYIGVAGEGRELVRIESRNGSVAVALREALQADGGQDYFRAGLMLTAGRVHLSEFTLYRDPGKAEAPQPMLRAVTPVFDASGRVFGMVALDKDVGPLFASAAAALPSGVLGYIADQQGRYLLHPDAKRAFAFEFDDKSRITGDFPLLKQMFESQARNELPFQPVLGGSGGYLAARRVFFDASDPSRFLLLAYHLPEKTVVQQASAVATVSNIVNILLAMLLVGGVSMLMLRRTFSPLERITAAARGIAAGNRHVRLAETGRGETEALLRRNQALMQNSMEGIHVMDVDGNVLEVNDAFCSMLGYTREEAMRLNVRDWEVRFSAGELIARFKSFIGRSDTFETVHRRRDGSVLDVEICATGVEIDGTSYLFASSRDITERKKAQAVLQRHHLVIETAMDGFWMADAEGFLEEVNEAYAKMSGYAMQELVGMHISELEASEHAEDVKAHIDKIMAQGHDRFETQHRRKDGRLIDIEASVTFMPESRKFFVFCHNITRRKQAEQELRVAAAAFETHDAILITDTLSNIIRVNRAFTQITGYSAEEVTGKNPGIMRSGRHDEAFYKAMWRQLLETGSWAGEIWDRRKNGEIYPKWMSITAVKNEHGETTQYVAIFSDITARKQEEEEIRNLAFYDALTQLPNRRLFLERFQAALAASARRDDHGALLFIDLDRFKLLNDTFGHDHGDLMLVEVANRIKSCVREMDTVARLGGDEFVVLLESLGSEREDAARKAGLVAEKIRDALARPYYLKDHEHHSSSSIGISLFQGGAEPVDELIKHADAAMYQAKEGGGNTVRFYAPASRQDG
jgi:diguanylate cyclase (GGDEF)-like protein/PAS domain S-box-containing protein